MVGSVEQLRYNNSAVRLQLEQQRTEQRAEQLVVGPRRRLEQKRLDAHAPPRPHGHCWGDFWQLDYGRLRLGPGRDVVDGRLVGLRRLLDGVDLGNYDDWDGDVLQGGCVQLFQQLVELGRRKQCKHRAKRPVEKHRLLEERQ